MKTLLSVIALAGFALGSAAGGEKVLVLKNKEGAALLGFDPVAYFTEGKAVKGRPEIQTMHHGAKYHFASAEHKAQFEANPAQYSPAYGGYCGYAASIDRLSPISPDWFQIIDGRLILQHNKKAYDKFNADLAGNIARADANWPGLVARNGTGGQALLLTDKKGVALGGCDPVSYFTEGRPQKGDPKIESTFDGALYHFVSQEHREIFEKEPAQYVPAYGGFCGYAASIGKVRPSNPRLWSIVEGRLILQHTRSAVELWEKDAAGNKARADQNWPLLIQAKAGQKNPVDRLLAKSVLSERR